MNAYQWFSLAAIALALATWLVYFGLVPAWNEARKIASLPRIQQIFVVLFTFGMIHSAVTKPDFRFDGGIKQGANASWATNDTIHIEWQRDLSTGVYVPETAAVYIDYRPNTETNAEWGLLAQTTVGAWSWEGTLADATNYDYNVWAYYIPPEPVHTNGVWVYKTMKDRPGKYIIPLRARVEVNGQAISTPLAKRRDMPYDAEVEYIASEKSCYIDTGITRKRNDVFYCDFQVFNISYDRNYIFGQEYPSRLRLIFEMWGTSGFGCYGLTSTGYFKIKDRDTKRHTLLLEQGIGFYFDGQFKSVTYQNDNASANTLLFASYSTTGGITKQSGARIFSYYQIRESEKIIDLIPVRFTNELGESEGAMYDKVSKKLFRNQGTGKFIVGPDKQ